jgi:hypothetical protein
MRRLAFAALLLPIFVACASAPHKLAGRYAIVADPRVEAMNADVIRALTQRVNLAASPAEADAVIVLQRGATDAHLRYEIRRGNEVIVSTDPAMVVNLRNDTRSVKENLEWDRREDSARYGDPYRMSQEEFRPRTAFNGDMALRSARRNTVRRISDMIVYDLRTKL